MSTVFRGWLWVPVVALLAACGSNPVGVSGSAGPAAGDAAAADALAPGADALDSGGAASGDASGAPGPCASDLECFQKLAPSDLCTRVYCDAKSHTCATAPHPDGTPCSDGDLCSGGDSCVAGACKPGSANFCATPEANCGNDKDDDGDGKADCADSDCAPKPACTSCAHDLCANGPAESPSCSGCVAQVCATEATCCSGGWGEYCVSLAASLCKLSCTPGCAGPCPEACAHSPCVIGPALKPGCSDCVQIVCGYDQYCCAVGWDEACVAIASKDCPPENCQTEVTCGDGLDNDKDGKADCLDPDCAAHPACVPTGGEANCSDGKDDDANGKTDCADAACQSAAGCGKESDCGDGLDNDGDGKGDCADGDCAGSPWCAQCAHPLCTSGAKLAASCDPCVTQVCNHPAYASCCTTAWDSKCILAVALMCTLGCGHELNCTDNKDNDLDGAVDCADKDCAIKVVCFKPVHETSCSDGIDNDANGQIDCADADCKASPPCGG